MATETTVEDRISIIRGFLAAAITTASDYKKDPSEANKQELMKQISLALAQAGAL